MLDGSRLVSTRPLTLQRNLYVFQPSQVIQT